MAMVRTKPVMYKRVRVDEIQTRRGPGLMLYFALFVLLPAFLLGLCYVRLNSDQVKLRRQLTDMRRQFGLRSKEQANLELEVEMYRNGSRIMSQVRQLRLNLQVPELGQVTRVSNGSPTVAGRPRSDAVVVGR